MKIRTLLSRVSDRHALKRAGSSYLDGFAAAFTAIYDGKSWEETLQKKFFIPDEASYDDDAFYQSASELTVANHIQRQSIEDFAVDKQVNPKNKKDVDVWFRKAQIKVSVEVKCPVESRANVNGRDGINLLLKTAGRIPDHEIQLRNFKDAVEGSHAGTVSFGKNKDLTLKDCLLSANAKLSPDSSVDNLNLLFLALGYAGNISDWYMYLYGEQGLFIADGFIPLRISTWWTE